MKIASHTRSFRSKGLKDGFTLIELLVVISIIAVLAGLLFPAMGAVRTMARKTSAKNDVTQIVNAVKMFYTEYGRYPLPGGTGAFTASNGSLMEILRYAGSNADTLNPRKIRFLEIPNAKNNRSGLALGTATTPLATADWLDPWGRPYVVFISTTYNGTVAVDGITGFANATINTEVAAASRGKDETTIKGDPILSWQ